MSTTTGQEQSQSVTNARMMKMNHWAVTLVVVDRVTARWIIRAIERLLVQQYRRCCSMACNIKLWYFGETGLIGYPTERSMDRTAAICLSMVKL
jgi:hypothetical protein